MKEDRKENSKKYKTESYSLDYLRPYDLEQDNQKSNNAKFVNDKYNNEEEDEEEPRPFNPIDEKTKIEKLNKALSRVRKSQEKRKKEDEERKKLHKSAKVANIVKELEDTRGKPEDEDQQQINIEIDNRNNYNQEKENTVKPGESRKKRAQRRSRGEY